MAKSAISDLKVAISSFLLGVIGTFKFRYPRLTLKEGSKVESDHTNRVPANDFL